MKTVAGSPAPAAASSRTVRGRPWHVASDVRRPASRWQPLLAGLALFGLALVPRLIGLEQHLTADDGSWIRLSSRFNVAVRRGDLLDTYQDAHPGVPVYWLAEVAIGPERAAELVARSGDVARMVKAPSYLGALFDARRALALVSAGLTVLLAALTWRLFGFGPAALAGLLLACEPFLVAHARLLHTDSLLAQLMAASLLAALIFFDGRGGRAYLVGSGLAAGLAFLTKVPAALLFGFVPLLGLAWTARRTDRAVGPVDTARIRRLALDLAVWALAAGVISALLWPSLWVSPFGTLSRLGLGVLVEGETPRTWGSFFLGRAVREDVGPLFYPLVTLLRLSPITLAGLLLLTWFGFRDRASGAEPETAPMRAWRPRLVALLAYLALFTLLMTLSPKKADRYLLPVYPILLILAALGLYLPVRRWRPGPRLIAGLALGLGQAALVASVQPYPLSFYDPLLGGAGLARQLVEVGWGEGTDQVAAYLDRQPDAPSIGVTTLYWDLIPAQFAGTGVPLWEWQRADYLAEYVNMDQRGIMPVPLQALVRSGAPVFTARINGLDYVRLYRIPPELKAQSQSSETPRKSSVPRP